MNIAYRYDVKSGITTAADVIVNFAFASIYLEIDVSEAAIIKFQLRDGTYGGEITYDPSIPIGLPFIPFNTISFMIRSADPAVPANYQLISWG